jgi:hypothetical protein
MNGDKLYHHAMARIRKDWVKNYDPRRDVEALRDKVQELRKYAERLEAGVIAPEDSLWETS